MALSVRRKAILFAVASVLAIPGLARAEETWSAVGTLSIANLKSFDISWVDYGLSAGTTVGRSYWLADRSNKAIDMFNIGATPAANGGLIQFSANFVGAFVGPTGAVNNDLSGPNGVMTIPGGNTQSGFTEIWAGDGPQVNVGCPAFLGGNCSSVKVINANTRQVRVIPTGGAARADELCFDPDDNIVLIANDAEADFSFGTPFISFISTKGPSAYTVVGNMQIKQTSNGIEQCQYDRQLKVFFLNLPEVNGPGNDTADGNVLVISPPNNTGSKGASLLGAFDIPNNNCAGPQGMAIANPAAGNTANRQMLLGCNAVSLKGPNAGLRNTVIIDKFLGGIIATGPGLGGADQVWTNGTHYFVTGSSCVAGAKDCNANGPQFGFVDVGNPASPSTDAILPLTPVAGVSSHSTASDCSLGISGGSGQAFLPVAGGVQIYMSTAIDADDTSAPCQQP
jgi:hypothetical protein